MTWTDAALFSVLLLGLFAGGFMVARSPTFWISVGGELLKALLPLITKRMTREEEAEWHAAIRSGQGDEWLRTRWRRRNKKR